MDNDKRTSTTRHFRIRASSCLILALCLAPGIGAGAAQDPRDDNAQAVFAGGCFWCMEPPFDKLDGVIATTSGYAGGDLADPTYEQVSAGSTGHAEVVRVTYDPDSVSYGRLLDVFWRNIDPLDAGGQFCDRGSQYRSAFFPQNDKQADQARQSLKALRESGKLPGDIVTTIETSNAFYPAEEYHQDYYMKNPLRYRFYRFTCGRDGRLEELWE